jgi:CheY-like chemotaxis protein
VSGYVTGDEVIMRRVLVVDDEPHIRTVLRGYLEADGFAVVEAADGEAALQAVHAGQPDLVLLDVMLPGIDGLEVTAEPGNSQPDHARGCASRGRGLPFLGGRADCPSSFLRQLQLLKESPGASLHGRPQYLASDTGR